MECDCSSISGPFTCMQDFILKLGHVTNFNALFHSYYFDYKNLRISNDLEILPQKI